MISKPFFVSRKSEITAEDPKRPLHEFYESWAFIMFNIYNVTIKIMEATGFVLS